MWFANALVYRYELSEVAEWSTLFVEEKLKPCPPHARFTYGWLPVFGDQFVQEIAGSKLVCLGKEERILPRGVIHKLLAEKIKIIETQQSRSVKRAEKAQLAEDLEFELLPKSFSVQKKLFALFDTTKQRLIINSSSANQCTQIIGLLKKTLPGLHVEPVGGTDNLAQHLASWLSDATTMPKNLTLASDCQLIGQNDDKKRIIYRGYELTTEEIIHLLSQGLLAAELSLIWNERIQLTLTQDLGLKRLKCLDYLVDEFNDISALDEEHLQRDAALMLVTNELRGLIDDLLVKTNTQQSKPPCTEPVVATDFSPA